MKIYLDYAATTPVDKEVERMMKPYFSHKFGNPNSLHTFGQEARKAIDESREKIARLIGTDFREIIFTGSATEANNLAIRGIVKATRDKELGIRPRIIVSAIEHESILETAKDLEREGVEVIYLPVNKQGIVDLKKLAGSLSKNTILVSVMYANNEIGTIQPIAEISKIIQDFRRFKTNSPINQLSNYPLFHTDAVQALQFLNCNVNDLGVDMMTLSGHKIYGPKGVGLLYIRDNGQAINKKNNISPIITGGGQEFGLRAGTENVANIVGFAKAIELADKNKEKEYKKILGLKKYFWGNINKIYPPAEINGIDCRLSADKYQALPNIINIHFPGQKAEELLIKLDLSGVAVSSGSACASFSAKPSHVLSALGHPEKRIKSSLRFSLGKFTAKGDLDQALKIFKMKIRE